MTTSTPLAGLNIVVTRPREQAAQLAESIERAGGKALLFPLLEIGPAADPQALQAVLATLHEFDLAIFISPNAVQYGLAAVRVHGALPAGLRIATVGQGSARTLHEAGIHAVIAPRERFDSEALLALPELQDMQGKRVVIFRGDGGREMLADTLKARGASVQYAECYRRIKPQWATAALLAAAPNILTVTSSEALRHLWDMSEDTERDRLLALPLFVPHPRIAEAAQQLGWPQVHVTTGGDDGMSSALIAWAAKHKAAP